LTDGWYETDSRRERNVLVMKWGFEGMYEYCRDKEGAMIATHGAKKERIWIKSFR